MQVVLQDKSEVFVKINTDFAFLYSEQGSIVPIKLSESTKQMLFSAIATIRK